MEKESKSSSSECDRTFSFNGEFGNNLNKCNSLELDNISPERLRDDQIPEKKRRISEAKTENKKSDCEDTEESQSGTSLNTPDMSQNNSWLDSRIQNIMQKKLPFSCSECGKNYAHNRSLRQHVKQLHPSKLETIAPTRPHKAFAFKCNECNRNFNNKHNIDYHIRKVHHPEKWALKLCRKPVTCPLCKADMEKDNYFSHCQQEHDISIQTEKLNFFTYEDFCLWKDNIEKETNSSFVKNQREIFLKEGKSKILLNCHRSGAFQSKSAGRRHLKSQGSCKIGGYCPAKIEIYKNNNNRKCNVVFVKTHVGHDNDIRHLTIPVKERQLLAAKIASRKPFDTILDELIDSVTENCSDRLHLLTKKDLHNIRQSLGDHVPEQNKNNDTCMRNMNSAHTWVSEMEKSESSCILFYKQQYAACSLYTGILEEDFILIIMNEVQYEMLNHFKSDCIYIDEIYEPKKYEFQLTTLSVLDEMRHGFPCAFMITNRNDEYVFKIFFNKIKEKCGLISPHAFMSDIAEKCYNAWVSVMEPVEIRLFCSWYVDKEWRKNLKKIKSLIKQAEAYKLLRSLLEEKDTTAFEKMLNNCIETLTNDPETADFGTYFFENFINDSCIIKWASCFHNNVGITTDTHIEHLHKSLKNIYLEGNPEKRLDKILKAMLSFVRDKLAYRQVILNKEKPIGKMRDLQKKHAEGINLQASVVKTKDGWCVQSSTTYESYLVSQNLKECCCQVICSDCQSCLHKYFCTCTDSSIRWNMCKHIHCVCKHILEREKMNEDEHDTEHPNLTGEDLPNDSSEISDHITTGKLRATESGKQSSDYVRDRKKVLKEGFFKLIERCESIEKIEALEKLFSQATSTIEAIENSGKRKC